MKKLGFLRSLCFLIISFCLSTSAFAQSAGEKLGALLQHIQTFQATFSQTIQDKSGSVLSQSEGSMAFERPGLFRWETQKPNQQLIIADGKTIWIYDKDLEQVSKQKQDIQNNNAPGLLLSDSVSHLISRFEIRENNSNTFILMPAGKETLFQSVKLVFDDQNILKQMVLYDHLGQMTVIVFTRAKINQPLSSGVFHFRMPAGIEAVDE